MGVIGPWGILLPCGKCMLKPYENKYFIVICRIAVYNGIKYGCRVSVPRKGAMYGGFCRG